MKKTSIINLVLVATITAACGKKEEDWEGGGSDRKVYLRSDTTAAYTKTEYYHYNGGSYYAFRPYSTSKGTNNYSKRTGYYSDAIHSTSNTGYNSSKSSISRGGFGHSSFHVSS
ncbi:hypothetical protein V3Q90_09715 [Flavobacterium oreochromis]|uniref:hypothetical protein n=1 Tax=Flavobacterium oreochromis TaxID=2906078 RepID=UPI00385FE0ED